MTNEQMERAIEFLLEHHSKVSADIGRHSEQINKHSEQIEKLTKAVEGMRLEMRFAIDNLIVSNEVTRKMTEEIAKLAIATSQRVSRLEDSSPPR